MLTLFRSSAITFAAILMMSGLAFAHAHLESAAPEVGGTVTVAPTKLDLHFSEALDLAFTGVVIEGPSGSKITTGEAELKPGDDKTLIVPLSETLEAGQYQVIWRALSKDGHTMKGTYGFTVTTQ